MKRGKGQFCILKSTRHRKKKRRIVQKHKKRTILIEDGCIKTDTSVGGYVDGIH